MSSSKAVDVAHLAARFLGVALPIGLTLDEVIIQGEALHLVGDPFGIVLPEPGSLEVRVGEASLAAFLNKKAPGGLSNFRITLGNGQIKVEATATIIIPLNVGAICKLRIEDERQLFVDLDKVDAIGGTGAFNLVQKQLEAINPVVDAAELPLAATLQSVEIEKGWIVLRGTIAPPPDDTTVK